DRSLEGTVTSSEEDHGLGYEVIVDNEVHSTVAVEVPGHHGSGISHPGETGGDRESPVPVPEVDRDLPGWTGLFLLCGHQVNPPVSIQVGSDQRLRASHGSQPDLSLEGPIPVP